MNPKKYLTPKYWAEKVFVLRPVRGGGDGRIFVHRGFIVPPEDRGLDILEATRGGSVIEEIRQQMAHWIVNLVDVGPEERGITVPPETRGIEA